MAEKLVNDIFHNPGAYNFHVQPRAGKWSVYVGSYLLETRDEINLAIFTEHGLILIIMAWRGNNIIYRDVTKIDGTIDLLPSFDDILKRYDLEMCDYVKS
jgi:hypothetical protein